MNFNRFINCLIFVFDFTFTKGKRDNSRKTGAAGGKKWKFTEADELIFQIIGSTSNVLDGMSTPESSGSSKENIVTHPRLDTDDSNTESMQNEKTLSENVDLPKPNEQRPLPIKKPRLQINAVKIDDLNLKSSEIVGLKDQLLLKQCALVEAELKLKELQCNLTKKDLYKKQLEIMKMEREMKLSDEEKFGAVHASLQTYEVVSLDSIVDDENLTTSDEENKDDAPKMTD